MSVLLREIKRSHEHAALVLEAEGFCTDSEIQSLTREDLHDLFPGSENIRLRKSIYETIHKEKPIDVKLTEVKGSLPHESVGDICKCRCSNGVLVECLHMLKDIKSQINHVQTRIGLLEEYAKDQQQEPNKGISGPVVHSGSQTPSHPGRDQVWTPGTQCSPQLRSQSQNMGECSGTMTKQGSVLVAKCGSNMAADGSSGPVVPPGSQTQGHPGSDQGDWSEHDCQEDLLAVRYQVVLGGKTFGAHDQLLTKVKDQERFWFKESDEDCQVIIVFCPISSRVESDVKAAMCRVKGDKPVILVLMHHRHDANQTLTRTTLRPGYQNIVLQVNTFYHDTVPGLLKCQQNNDAAAEIQKTLLKYSIQERTGTNGNCYGGGGSEGLDGGCEGHGGGGHGGHGGGSHGGHGGGSHGGHDGGSSGGHGGGSCGGRDGGSSGGHGGGSRGGRDGGSSGGHGSGSRGGRDGGSSGGHGGGSRGGGSSGGHGGGSRGGRDSGSGYFSRFLSHFQ